MILVDQMTGGRGGYYVLHACKLWFNVKLCCTCVEGAQ